MSVVVSTSIQKSIFSSSEYGLINRLLSLLSLEPVQWLDNPDVALLTLMIMPFFFGFSQNMLFFLAGLKQIPKTFDEAAQIDGATRFQVFRHINLPLLKPIFFLNMVLSIISGFRVLGPMQLITNGGPAKRTLSVVLYIYNNAFVRDGKMGMASAAAFLLFVIILIVTLIQMKIQGEQISYE